MISEDRTTSQNISIVICTKGRHDLIVKTVSHLQSVVPQDRYLEIIVIEETDHPQPLEGEKLNYHTIPERGRGLGFTRNTGLKKARGSIVVFIDDDILVAENWFENLLAPFRDENVGAIGGAVLPDLSQINTIGKCASFLGFPAGGLKRYLGTKGQTYETNLLSTGNCAFRTELARSVGGFDELLRNGEDTEFFSRISAQSKTIFVPKATVFHRQRDSLIGVIRWFSKRGRGSFLGALKRGTHPCLAVIFPLRRNFLIKLLTFMFVALVLLSLFPFASFAFILSTYLIWNIILWKRENKLYSTSSDGFDEGIICIRDTITAKDVLILLPLVKLCMDIGREIGKLKAFLHYINHRVLAKPLVLTFHNIGTPKEGISSSISKYYCSKSLLQQILKDSERDGWVVVSLSELVERLKANSRTLYFEKIFAVTFDDAYASIFEPLSELSDTDNGSHPFTIFVPTALVGNTNEWVQRKGSKREEILNWLQIEELRTKGIEVGSHTCHHVHLLEVSRENKIREIKKSMSDLRCNLSHYYSDKNVLLSYPYGEYDHEVIQIVKEAGYAGAVANYEGNIRPRINPYQIPRFSLSTDMDWRNICRKSRSFWFKELLKDIRDWISD